MCFAAPDTPAVLFEAGYLSNADDELLLRDPEQRAKIVLALAQAIEADVAARTRRSVNRLPAALRTG